MAASRLKGKPLLEINNVPIICHVLNKAMETGFEAIVAVSYTHLTMPTIVLV